MLNEHPRLLRHADRETFVSSAFGEQDLINRIAGWDGDKEGFIDQLVMRIVQEDHRRLPGGHRLVSGLLGAMRPYRQTIGIRASEDFDNLVALFGEALPFGSTVQPWPRAAHRMQTALPVLEPLRPATLEWGKIALVAAKHLDRINAKALSVRGSRDCDFVDLEIDLWATRKQTLGWLLTRHKSRREDRREDWSEPSAFAALTHSTDTLLLLQGEPGSGKSIALRSIARRQLMDSAGSRCPTAVKPLLRRMRRIGRPIPLPTRQGRALDAPIPIHLDLKELDLPRSYDVTAQDVAAFVRDEALRLFRVAEESLDASLMARYFDWGLKHGRWLFLLDSFDEIKALLSSVGPDERVRAYAEAIEQFAIDAYPCRTVFASRPYRSPKTLLGCAWMSLKALDAVHIGKVVGCWFRDDGIVDQVLAELRGEHHVLGDFVRNPLFLALICAFRQIEGRLPKTLDEAFDGFVTRRLERDERRFLNLGLDLTGTCDGASAVALRMLLDDALGIEPRRHDLLRALDVAPWPLTVSPETVLSALEKAELAQTNQAGDDRAERFAFGHRRLLEFFATKAVIAGGSGVSAETLLNDDRWRETAVTLLNSDVGERHPLLDALQRALTAGADTLGVPASIDGEALAASAPSNLRKALAPLRKTMVPEHFQWPARSGHRLGILQDASVRRAQTDLTQTDLPIRHEADRLLIAAMELGILTDQKLATDLAAAGSPEGTLFVLTRAFQSHRYVLTDAAYKQTLRLRTISADLLAFIRESLLEQWATGALEKDAENVRVQLHRLDSARKDATRHLGKTFQMLRAFPRIDNFLLAMIALTVGILYAEDFSIDKWLGPLLGISIIIGIMIGLHLMSRRILKGSLVAWRIGDSRKSVVRLVLTSGLWSSLLWRGIPSLFFIFLAFFVLTDNFPTWFKADVGALALAILCWLIWGCLAPTAIALGRFTDWRKWPLLIFAPFSAIWHLVLTLRPPSRNAMLFSTATWALLFIALGLGGHFHKKIFLLLDYTETALQEIGLPKALAEFFPLIFLYVAVALFLIIQRIRSNAILSNAKEGVSEYSAVAMLDVWSRFPGSLHWHHHASLARWINDKNHLIICEESRRVLLDAIRAIERDHRQKLRRLSFKRRPIDPSWSPAFQAWYRKRAPRLFGLADWHGTPLNELQLLLEQVEAGLKDSAERQST